MKTLEILNFKAFGKVTIYKVREGEEPEILTQYNNILTNAKPILVSLLTNGTYGPLDKMRIENAGVVLASVSPLTKIANTAGPIYSAEFDGIFDYATFSGNFTDVFLAHPSLGDFSQLHLTTPLSKSSNEKILISWIIQIN